MYHKKGKLCIKNEEICIKNDEQCRPRCSAHLRRALRVRVDAACLCIYMPAVDRSLSDCRYNIVSNHNWRCTATQPRGDSWQSTGYTEDVSKHDECVFKTRSFVFKTRRFAFKTRDVLQASWEIPAHGGVNGVSPWGHRPDMDVATANGMQSPQWIWTSDFQGAVLHLQILRFVLKMPRFVLKMPRFARDRRGLVQV